MHSRPNSFVTQPDASTTQLTYGLQLNPAPLTVSLASQPVVGSLQFVVTNPTGSTINVTSVAFTIQVGTAGDNLTPTTQGVNSAVSDTANWQVVGPSSTISSGPAIYTLQPATGSSVALDAGQSVVVQIFGFSTVATPGNTTINVKEMISGPPAFTSFLVTVFPSGFYFNGLSATVQSGSQLVPVAQVANGTTVTLVWNSSVVDLNSFAIYYSNATQGQQTAKPSDIGEWTSPGLTSDTVFTIVVTASIVGGQPLSAALTTAVSIQNPALVAASINAGAATFTGQATFTGAVGANAITATGLTVNGAAIMNQATVNGQTTVNGALNANSVTSPALTVTGNASVSTLTANNTLTVTGASTLNGGLTGSAGPVALFSGAQGIGGGTYTAGTDGFVIASVTYPSSVGTKSLCHCVITLSNSDGASSCCTGGNVGLFDSNFGKWTGINNNSCVLPVRRGTTYSVSVWQDPQNQSSADLTIYWMPMGKAPTGQATTERIGDAPVSGPPSIRRVPVDKLPLIPELLDAIDSLLPEPMGQEKRNRFVAVLERMNSDDFVTED